MPRRLPIATLTVGVALAVWAGAAARGYAGFPRDYGHDCPKNGPTSATKWLPFAVNQLRIGTKTANLQGRREWS